MNDKGSAVLVNIIVSAIIITIVLLIAIFITMPTTIECDDCFEVTGYLSYYMEINHEHWFTIDGWEMYVTEDIEFDVNKYVKHNVTMKGYAGCGNRVITHMKNLDTGEEWITPGADLTICWTVALIIVIVIVTFLIFGPITIYHLHTKKKAKK